MKYSYGRALGRTGRTAAQLIVLQLRRRRPRTAKSPAWAREDPSVYHEREKPCGYNERTRPALRWSVVLRCFAARIEADRRRQRETRCELTLPVTPHTQTTQPSTIFFFFFFHLLYSLPKLARAFNVEFTPVIFLSHFTVQSKLDSPR